VQLRNEQLQRVTEILSHDLREPVRKIGLFADLVRGQPNTSLDDESLAALRKIQVESQQIDNLIHAVRQYLESDAPYATEKVKLQELVATAAKAVTAKAAFSDWDVHCDPLPEIEGRRGQLQLVFVLLMENAVKFRDPGRRLQVTVRGRLIQQNLFEATKERYRYVDFVRLEIQDNGVGFPPKYRNYVFGLLKKVDLSSPGLGVGLAICRKIVASHFGSIEVDSEPGVGTTITLLLPLAP
jgi:sigma-B regulation protein RsbU (phosphoserine phosphatase)